MSVRGIRSMLYAPKASMPRDLPGPLKEIPLEACAEDDREVEIHKAIYASGNFQTAMHCYVPEAEAGDYVLVHVGFAIAIIDEQEAARVFDLLRQIDESPDRQGAAT